MNPNILKNAIESTLNHLRGRQELGYTDLVRLSDRLSKALHLANVRSHTDNQSKQMRWDSMYLGWARDLAQHSCDPKFKVGALIVNETAGTPVGQGYNGRGKGRPNERLSMETGKSGFVHAEANAIAKASWQYGCDYTLYCTLAPCVVCAGLILNTPIKRVVIGGLYPGDLQGLKELEEGLGEDNVIMLQSGDMMDDFVETIKATERLVMASAGLPLESFLGGDAKSGTAITKLHDR